MGKTIEGIISAMALMLMASGGTSVAAPASVSSPDGYFTLNFEVKAMGGAPNRLVYNIAYRGKSIIADSTMGFSIRDQSDLATGFTLNGISTLEADTTWIPISAERSPIRDDYRQLTVEVTESSGLQRKLQITFRAYNEGVAFAYTFPTQPNLTTFTITAEDTEFKFNQDHPCWVTSPNAQSYATQTTLGSLSTSNTVDYERALVVHTGSAYVSMSEANQYDYARMRLRYAGAHTLVPKLGGLKYNSTTSIDPNSTLTAPATTPWRVIMATEQPGGLIENNFIHKYLCAPSQLADTSWIKPGKCIRCTTLTTASARNYIDFAANHGLQYIELDAGWYGPEGSASSDPTKPIAAVDIPAIVAYGNSKGIGLVLYINHIALEKINQDSIFKTLQDWGAKGIKFGFVNVGSQTWTKWMYDTARKAAGYQLFVLAHDDVRPTGYERTLPSFLSFEGIPGDETKPTTAQDCMTFLGRQIMGPSDHTFTYYTSYCLGSCNARQLAKPIIFFGGTPFLYWYDNPGNYQNEPELELWDKLPATWDLTKVLELEMGSHVTVVRKRGAEWFLGSITTESRNLSVPLTFLDAGRTYSVNVYKDGGSSWTKVTITRTHMTSAQTLTASMVANGGVSAWIHPTGSIETVDGGGTVKDGRLDNDAPANTAGRDRAIGITAMRLRGTRCKNQFSDGINSLGGKR